MFLALVMPVTEKREYWRENQAGREENYYVHHKQPFLGKFCAVETLRNRNGL